MHHHHFYENWFRWFLFYQSGYYSHQKHPPEVFHKKCVLKNFAKSIEKDLCQSLSKRRLVTIFYEDWKDSRARIFLIVFVDILFSTKVEYLKRRRVVKYFKILRVLILEFYPYFSQTLFFNKVVDLSLKYFQKIFKNTFFTEHLRVTASESLLELLHYCLVNWIY